MQETAIFAIGIVLGHKRFPWSPMQKAPDISAGSQPKKQGAGELLLNSIDRDGTMQGCDLELIKQVSQAVGIPVVACGGAGTVQHLAEAIRAGASAAAGSMFVFQGPYRAVLINHPTRQELPAVLEP